MDEKQLNKRDKKLLELAAQGGTDKELVLFEQMNELEDKFDSTVEEIKKSLPNIEEIAKSIKGKDGVNGKDGLLGETGEPGEPGPPGVPGKDGKNGKDGRDGRDGASGRDGQDGRDGVDGPQGEPGKDGSEITPDEVIGKINQSKLFISKERIDGLVEALSQAVHSAVGVTTTIFFKGGTQVGRAKNINFTGSAVSSVTVVGDTAQVTLTGGSGGGQVNSVVAGTGISVDATDPANPIVTNTGTAPSFVDNEVVSGSGTSYTLANTPVAGSVHVYGAGVRLTPGAGNDYTISGTGITIINGTYATGEVLADYRK